MPDTLTPEETRYIDERIDAGIMTMDELVDSCVREYKTDAVVGHTVDRLCIRYSVRDLAAYIVGTAQVQLDAIEESAEYAYIKGVIQGAVGATEVLGAEAEIVEDWSDGVPEKYDENKAATASTPDVFRACCCGGSCV
jgi:hypothetical protein